MSPEKLKRLVELCGEIEELLQVSTTFLFGDSDTDIRGMVLADMETTAAILGESVTTENLN